MYRKAFTDSHAPLDQYKMAFTISLVSYFGKLDDFLDDYTNHAMLRQWAENTDLNMETSEMLKLLNALSKQRDLQVMAKQFARLDFGNLRELADLKGCLSMDELAYYVVISVLSSLPRNEIQDTIMSNSSILTLLESNQYTQNVIQHFMLGRFEEALKATNKIRDQLQWDQYFGAYGNQAAFKEIRTRTLQMYVKPYKVLDLREISKEFGIDLDTIELELADLITSGQIKAKIDSYKKLLIST